MIKLQMEVEITSNKPSVATIFNVVFEAWAYIGRGWRCTKFGVWVMRHFICLIRPTTGPTWSVVWHTIDVGWPVTTRCSTWPVLNCRHHDC